MCYHMQIIVWLHDTSVDYSFLGSKTGHLIYAAINKGSDNDTWNYTLWCNHQYQALRHQTPKFTCEFELIYISLHSCNFIDLW